jgi:hypothetical protein
LQLFVQVWAELRFSVHRALRCGLRASILAQRALQEVHSLQNAQQNVDKRNAQEYIHLCKIL